MKNSQKEEASIQQASKLFNQGRLQDAENICREILQLNPANTDALHILGLIAFKYNHAKLAIDFLNKAIQLDSIRSEYHDSIGIVYQSMSDSAKAIEHFRRALSLNSNSPKTHYNLGNTFLQNRLFDEARECYLKALVLAPDYQMAINNLATVHREQGEFSQAEVLLHKVLQTSPHNLISLSNLAQIYEKTARYDKAINTYKKMIEINPEYVEAFYNTGNIYLSLKNYPAAISHYQQALNIRPDLVEALNNIALCYTETRSFDQAIEHYNLALKANPGYTFTYLNFANLHKQGGAYEDAEKLYLKAISIDPNFLHAYYNLACLYADLGQSQHAIQYFEKVIALNNTHAMSFKNIGNIYKDLGEFDKAISYFEQAIALDPALAEAYRELASVKKFERDDAQLKHMSQMMEQKNLTPSQKMHLGFGLAKSFEALKEYDQSFNYLLQANQARRAEHPYEREKTLGIIHKTRALFSGEFLARFNGMGDPDPTPIFILGMPRSGSSLIEQILASHSQVFGAGELNYIELAINRFCSVPSAIDYPECLKNLDTDMIQQMSADYLHKIRQLCPDKALIVDKMPHNFIYLGLIKILLPNSKIIHCTRNPIDTCFSIFKHGFFDGHAYADDLQDLAEYYNSYSELMQHWNQLFSDEIYQADYETLVQNQQQETHRLLSFCGLDWEDSCLDFHKTKRRVHTASSTQVRKGIYKSSVNLWENYRQHLTPLIENIR